MYCERGETEKIYRKTIVIDNISTNFIDAIIDNIKDTIYQ